MERRVDVKTAIDKRRAYRVLLRDPIGNDVVRKLRYGGTLLKFVQAASGRMAALGWKASIRPG